MPPAIPSFLFLGILAGIVGGQSIGVWAAPQSPALPSAARLWEQVDDDGRVGGWFHIYERNNVYAGDLVKIFVKPGEHPNPICTKCSGSQKNQPTLGLTLIKGMQRRGLNYENGSILDPRDGSVYRARMEVSPDGRKLMVRGFLGIDLFGQSQIWRRLPDSAMREIPILPRPDTGSKKIPKTADPEKAAPPASAASPDHDRAQDSHVPRSNGSIDGQLLRGSVQ